MVYYLYLTFDDDFCGWSALGFANNVCCAKTLYLLSKNLYFLTAAICFICLLQL